MRSQRLLSVLLVTGSTLVFAPAAGTAPAAPATCGLDASAGTLGVGDPYYPPLPNRG